MEQDALPAGCRTNENGSMSSESPTNPYSLGTDVERSEFAWTDGDVEFTEKEIRVRGDFELPPICIHTGVTEDLIQRKEKLTAHTVMAIRFQWMICILMMGISFLRTSYAKNAVEGLNLDNLLDSWFGRTVFLGSIGLLILLNWRSRKVTVQWYLSRSYSAPREKMRTIFGGTIVLIAILALVMIYETASLWWLALVVATALAGVILGRERAIGASSFRNGRSILKGHSAEFARVWAAKTAARNDEQDGLSGAQSREGVIV